MRRSCARSPRRAADAGAERPIRPTGHAAAAPGHTITPGLSMPDGRGCWRASWDRCLLHARHGRLRRNAVSLHGVRLSGAPGAPLWIGCSSANRALAGKHSWDGIVAVPVVFGAGCLALSPVRRVRAARPSGRFPTHPPGLRHTATHGGTHSVAAIADTWRQENSSADQVWPRGAAIPGRRARWAQPGGRESRKDH